MGKRRDFLRRREVKADELLSIRMMSRDWLKRLDTWKEFKEELKR